jgi:hypothetical protein
VGSRLNTDKQHVPKGLMKLKKQEFLALK